MHQPRHIYASTMSRRDRRWGRPRRREVNWIALAAFAAVALAALELLRGLS